MLSVLFAWRAAPAQTPDQPPAYDLKAAFVYQFPNFVEWPDAALAGRTTLDLCVARPNPFGSVLRDLAAGESLNGRALAVRDVPATDPLDRCHLLFVPAAVSSRRLLDRASALPILTIGETERFLDEGGIIRLHILDRRVRFDINASAASRARLRLSAQLLQLAAAIRGRP